MNERFKNKVLAGRTDLVYIKVSFILKINSLLKY